VELFCSAIIASAIVHFLEFIYNNFMISQLVTILLILVCVYHFVAGLFAIGPKSWLQFFGKNVYALEIPENYEPRYEVCIRFLGLLAWTVSALTAQALIFPDHRLQCFTLFVLSFLFLSRALLRVILRKVISDAYQLSFERSLGNIVFNLVLCLFTMTLAAMIL
jgi:hypothetical protein